MTIFDKMGYMAGFMPMADVKAQHRCYEYLKTAQDKLAKQIAEVESQAKETVEPGTPHTDPALLLKNQSRQIESTLSLLEQSEGRYNWKKANMFWQYWDKNKETAVSVVEGETVRADKSYAIIKELEDGRYDTTA